MNTINLYYYLTILYMVNNCKWEQLVRTWLAKTPPMRFCLYEFANLIPLLSHCLVKNILMK